MGYIAQAVATASQAVDHWPDLKSFQIGNAILAFWNWQSAGEDPVERLPDCAPSETAEFRQFNCENRRKSWLAGRLVARHLYIRHLGIAYRQPHRLRVVSGNLSGKSDRPRLFLDGSPINVGLSISHTDHAVLVALTPGSILPGVDLVRTAEVTSSLCRRWFTAAEQRLSESAPDAGAKIWAAKESAYKALQQGESFFPLRFEVVQMSSTSCICHYAHASGPRRIEITTWHADPDHCAAYAQSHVGNAYPHTLREGVPC